MTRRTKVIATVVAVMALIATLGVAESKDRDRHGTASAVGLLPQTVAGFGAPKQSGSRCVAMLGSREGFDLRWHACDAALPFTYFAEREVTRATELPDGAGRYLPRPTYQTLPAGTAVYLNCGNLPTQCDGESLLLVGRQGLGEWDIRAYLPPDRSTTEWEEKAISLMVSVWRT